MAEPPTKAKRLTDKERLEILDLLENEPTMTKVELGRRYGISGSAITKLSHNADAIRSRHADGSVAHRDRRQRGTKAIAQPFEEKLYRWLHALEAHRIVVPPAQVMEKALVLSTHARIPNFVASNGWYYRFLNRYGFKTTSSAKLESSAVTPDATLDQLRSLRVKLASFGPECVYSMETTDLFYRWLPHYEVLCPHYEARIEDLLPKDRTTLLVCANATGSHKLPPLVVDVSGHSLPARYRESKTFPLPYTTSGKAWCVDGNVFKHWFETLFVPAVRAQTSRPVVLLLDNSRGQFAELTRENVTTMLLPPQTPALYVPMGADLLLGLKLRYKFRLIQELLSFSEKPEADLRECIERGRTKLSAGLDCGRPPHIVEAMALLKDAWDDIPPTRLQDQWRRTTLLFSDKPLPAPEGDRDTDLIDELVQVFPPTPGMLDVRAELLTWLHADTPDNDMLKQAIIDDLERRLFRVESQETPLELPPDEASAGPWPGANAILKTLSALEALYEHPSCHEYLGDAVVSEHLQQVDMQRRVVTRTKSMKDRKRRREEGTITRL